jgi:uncharacterized membrane protein (DUF4010 family)
MDLGELFQRLGTALGLGIIVGLQRERSGSPLAGIRTFPLVALFGCLSAFLALEFGGWIIAAGILAIAALITIGYLELKTDESAAPQNATDKPGLTTEVAMLVMFALGAYIANGQLGIAAAIGGTVAVLLHLKPQMHSVARRLEDPDFKPIMQFVLITLVVLPILPNKGYGPFQILNPFKIWLMVVLIVGISLAGYLIYKFLGERIGTIAGGLLGGLISSTATTVSFARQTKQAPDRSKAAALVIMLASSIVFARILILIGATSPQLLSRSWEPFGALFVMLLLICFVLWRTTTADETKLPPQENPSQLKTALIFGGLYAVILMATAGAKEYFGAQGLYVVAVLSGLTDMDAITLSLSQIVNVQQVNPQTGWRLIMIASLSNLAFKTGVVAFLGSRKLLARISVLFAIAFAIGLGIILFWPG